VPFVVRESGPVVADHDFDPVVALARPDLEGDGRRLAGVFTRVRSQFPERRLEGVRDQHVPVGLLDRLDRRVRVVAGEVRGDRLEQRPDVAFPGRPVLLDGLLDGLCLLPESRESSRDVGDPPGHLRRLPLVSVADQFGEPLDHVHVVAEVVPENAVQQGDESLAALLDGHVLLDPDEVSHLARPVLDRGERQAVPERRGVGPVVHEFRRRRLFVLDSLPDRPDCLGVRPGSLEEPTVAPDDRLGVVPRHLLEPVVGVDEWEVVPGGRRDGYADGRVVDRPVFHPQFRLALAPVGDVPDQPLDALLAVDFDGARADLDRDPRAVAVLVVQRRPVAEPVDRSVRVEDPFVLGRVLLALLGRPEPSLVHPDERLPVVPHERDRLFVHLDGLARLDVGDEQRLRRRLHQRLVLGLSLFLCPLVRLDSLGVALRFEHSPDESGEQLDEHELGVGKFVGA